MSISNSFNIIENVDASYLLIFQVLIFADAEKPVKKLSTGFSRRSGFTHILYPIHFVFPDILALQLPKSTGPTKASFDFFFFFYLIHFIKLL